MLFQAVCVLVEEGVLEALESFKDGATVKELSAKTSFSEYALGVLLDMAASGRIVTVSDDGRYAVTRVGYFLVHDKMTRTNLRFFNDVCYKGMASLSKALHEGRPAGLSEFNGQWETIYPHLRELPDKARNSWFAWDHLYSDTAFEGAVNAIASKFNPGLVYDIGGNTGKFAIKCCSMMKDVRVRIIDLPEQVETAEENIRKAGLSDRVSFMAADVLKDPKLPGAADIWWMSQFLDCFSPDGIKAILANIRSSMKDGARVCILEPLPDRQKFEASSYVINAGSLYFTAMANGCSRFYRYEVLAAMIEGCGFKVDETVDGLGISNSLIICSKA